MKRTLALVAGDDPHASRLMTSILQSDGYRVHAVSTGQDALSRIEAEMPDLVILDIHKPNLSDTPVLSGIDVCEQARKFSMVPIIIVAALGAAGDKIWSLEAGADDYLTKPFSSGELLARVHALLRRTRQGVSGSEQQSRITIGKLMVDWEQCLVTMDGHPVKLTATEFRILAYLAQNAGRVLTPNLLLAHVWGWSSVDERNLLKVNISRLRRKIEPNPSNPIFIVTRSGFGYQMSTAAHE